MSGTVDVMTPAPGPPAPSHPGVSERTPARARAQEAIRETDALRHAVAARLAALAPALAGAREDHGPRGDALRWARTSLQDVRDEFLRAVRDPHRLETWEHPAPELLARYPDPLAACRAEMEIIISRPRRLRALLAELDRHHKRFLALAPPTDGLHPPGDDR